MTISHRNSWYLYQDFEVLKIFFFQRNFYFYKFSLAVNICGLLKKVKNDMIHTAQKSVRSVFALADDHKSLMRRLIRRSISVWLVRYESDVQCETMAHAFHVFRSAVWIRPTVPFHRFQQGKLARFSNVFDDFSSKEFLPEKKRERKRNV